MLTSRDLPGVVGGRDEHRVDIIPKRRLVSGDGLLLGSVECLPRVHQLTNRSGVERSCQRWKGMRFIVPWALLDTGNTNSLRGQLNTYHRATDPAMWSTDSRWFDVAAFSTLWVVLGVLFGKFEQHKPAW